MIQRREAIQRLALIVGAAAIAPELLEEMLEPRRLYWPGHDFTTPAWNATFSPTYAAPVLTLELIQKMKLEIVRRSNEPPPTMYGVVTGRQYRELRRVGLI